MALDLNIYIFIPPEQHKFFSSFHCWQLYFRFHKGNRPCYYFSVIFSFFQQYSKCFALNKRVFHSYIWISGQFFFYLNYVDDFFRFCQKTHWRNSHLSEILEFFCLNNGFSYETGLGRDFLVKVVMSFSQT